MKKSFLKKSKSFLRENSKTIDSIGGVFWLIMDFFWMIDAPKLAIISFFFASIPMLIGGVFFSTKSIANKCSDVATFFWFLMNSNWMISDITGNQNYLYGAAICFSVGMIMVLISFVVAKIEKEQTEFNRIKNQ